uniref:Uncharacterized protein n=1 Tax=Strigamia maritima TaxID=126957 RepID=T1J9U4_STRMM
MLHRHSTLSLEKQNFTSTVYFCGAYAFQKLLCDFTSCSWVLLKWGAFNYTGKYDTVMKNDAQLTVQNVFINVKNGSSSRILCHPSNDNPADFNFYRTESGQGSVMPMYSDVRRLPAPTHSVALIMEYQDGQSRFGTYTCKENKGDSAVTTFKLPDPSIAEVKAAQTFITKNLGEDVTFHVIVSGLDLELVWLHDQNEVLDWRNETTVRIESVNTSNSGIYECYYDGMRDLGTHALIQLLVRGCAAFKWGPNCEFNCPSCYNGGICNDIWGVCICPPGFDGQNCEIACEKNSFGKDCKKKCDYETPVDSDEPCATYMFCLPHPYGCGCAAGFKGNLCRDDCDNYSYGSDCTQTCHCEGGLACDKRTGNCSTGCSDGWTGNSCEIQICSEGNYGPNCSLECSCANGGECDPVNGSCNCLDLWKGTLCNETAPIIISLESLEVNTGAEVNLSCVIESTNPLTAAEILVEDLLDLPSTIREVNDTFYEVITSTNISKNITVNCTGTNDYGTTDQQFILTSIEPPYLNSKPEVLNLTDNSMTLFWNNWTFGIDGGGKLHDVIEYKVLWKEMSFDWIFNDWSSKTFGVQIGQLSPDIEYEIAIQCRRPGIGGEGPFSSSIFVKTNCHIPTTNATLPSNLTYIEVGSTFIILKWENVHYKTGNCKNMTYDVMWNADDESANEEIQITDTEDTLNLTNLRPFTNYLIEISLIADEQTVGTPATIFVDTTISSCSEDKNGPNCSLASSFANGSECDSVNGSCNCLDTWNGTLCNGTAPNIISLEPLEVNTGAEVNLSCTIESTNPLTSAGILLEDSLDLPSTELEINDTFYDIIVRANITKSITVNCTGTNDHGTTDQQFILTSIDPPYLKSEPQVLNVTDNSVSLLWNNWTYGLDGGGKLNDIIEYRVLIRVMTYEWFNDWSSKTSGVQIGQLSPDIEYEVAIQCRRPGIGGEGPFSPSIFVKTNCHIPTTNATFPNKLTYIEVGSTFIILKWENMHYKRGNCKNMTYDVMWNAGDESAYEKMQIMDTEDTLNLTNLRPFINYQIEISLIADELVVGIPATISVNTTMTNFEDDDAQNSSTTSSYKNDSVCSLFNGFCNCSDSFNWILCNETSPMIILFEPLEVNTGAEVNLSCTIESSSPLISASIWTIELPNLNSSVQEIHELQYEVILNRNVTENMTVNCTGTNSYETTSQEFTITTIDPPFLISAPELLIKTENTIEIEWDVWMYGKDGGGKFNDDIEYRVVILSSDWYYDWHSDVYGTKIGQLNPDVEYEIAIQCRRPGVGGEGPFSPSMIVRTNCAIPASNTLWPKGLRLFDYGNIFITLKWMNKHYKRGVCSNMTYEIKWNAADNTSENETIEISATESKFTARDLKQRTSYQFEISLILDGQVVGIPATLLVNTTTTPIGPVENFSASAFTSREVFLSWEKPLLINETDHFLLTIELLEIIGCDKISSNIEKILVVQQEENITNLHPNSIYSASVEAYIAEEHGQPVQINFTTLGDVPDGHPSNLRGTIVSPTEMKFEWDSVSCELINSASWKYEYGIQNDTALLFSSTTDNYVILLRDTFDNNDTFVVRLVTSHATSQSAKLQINLGQPQNVTLVKATATTLEIEWKKPIFKNVLLSGYKNTEEIINPDAYLISLPSLTPASEYNVEITAVYSDSESKPTRKYFRTTYVDFEGGVPENGDMLQQPPTPIFSDHDEPVCTLTIFPIQNAAEAKAYQIIVEDKENNEIIEREELQDYYAALRKRKLFYITAEVNSSDVLVYGYNLTLGDSFTYNGYHNVALKNHLDYRFHVRAIGWNKETSPLKESLSQALLPVAGESKKDDNSSCIIMQLQCVWFIILVVSLVIICLILLLISLAIFQKRKNGGSLEIQQSEECLDTIGRKGTMRSILGIMSHDYKYGSLKSKQLFSKFFQISNQLDHMLYNFLIEYLVFGDN